MGVFSIRFEGETDWLNFYLLMAPEDFWPILLARSIDSIVGIGLMVALAFLVGHVMSPLGALTSNAERLGRGEETGALQPEGSIDIREAIVAFNRMEKRIVHALQYQVALLRSLGHDLSGPLDRLRDATEELKSEEARERLVKRLSAVDSIVHSVASFARETRRDPETSRIDLPSLIEALVDEQVENGCDATVSIKTHPVIRGRYNALTRAFRNLIENAIKYGGSAHATVSSEDEMAVLQVEDDGPGIAAESLESAFEPFQRLGASGPGSGLGLSIVQAIIVDHGGTVELTNRSGGGLKATVLLPLEATHHPG
jgi:signal transduction histidine kinase